LAHGARVGKVVTVLGDGPISRLTFAWEGTHTLKPALRLFERNGPDCGACVTEAPTTYEEAVRSFAPYRSVQEVNEPVRRGLSDLIHMAEVDGRTVYMFINNRLEGNSPMSIAALLGY
jgi:hypothetical protein